MYMTLLCNPVRCILLQVTCTIVRGTDTREGRRTCDATGCWLSILAYHRRERTLPQYAREIVDAAYLLRTKLS